MRRRIIALLIASALFALPVSAQEAQPRTIPFEGPEIACHILHSFKMEPIDSIEDAVSNPKQTVVIVFGDPRILRELHKASGGLKEYLSNGGSLLIATDRQWTDPNLSFRISGEPVQLDPAKKSLAYGGELACPLLSPLDGDHPVFSFLQNEIATNRPSNVDVFDSGAALQDLLAYPFGPRRLPGGGLRGGPQRYMVGSAKDAPPQGRALYIAGHGMFINAMMLQRQTDNFAFTVNAVRWLSEGADHEPRTKTLFIVNGEIITNFDMKLTPPPPPIPIPPMKMLGRLIRGLENERFFHRVLGEALGSHIGVVVAVIFGLVTIIVLLYGAKKFIAGRHHLETGVPSIIASVPLMSSTAPIEQRQQAMLRQGEFVTEARQLALAWLRQEFEVMPDRWQPEVDARFAVTASFWTRGRLQRKADAVLRFVRVKPAQVSRHGFFVLVEALQELNAAFKEGRLALLVDGKNVRHS
jgi:hypothetical protein